MGYNIYMNSEPRKHHYVQQSYLRGFEYPTKGDEPKIVMYIKEQPLSPPKIISIKNAACKRDLHTIKIENKDDRRFIEGILSNLENHLITNIKEILINKSISEENKIGLAMMILLMKSRVPQNLDAMRNHYKATLETIAELNFSKNPLGLDGTFKEHFQLNIYNNLPIYCMLTSVCNEKAIEDICAMNFSLLNANDENIFICSDAPVSYYCPNHDGVRGVGLSHSELEIFLPLDKNFGILCSHKPMSRYKKLNYNEINEYNRRTIITSEKYIYSSDVNQSINKLIESNENNFSGIKYREWNTPKGKLQMTSFIPVTNIER